MKKRNIALFAALTLLCGCSGNTESTPSGPESVLVTVEESAPEQTSVENSSAPAGVGNADDVDGRDSVTAPVPESTTATGVSLGAGDWTEYDSTFKLNGTWCTLEELPLTRTEYQLPDKWKDNDLHYSFGGGTMFLTVQEANHTKYENTSPAELWYIDLESGAERLVYSCGENEFIRYTGEKYFAVENTADRELQIGSAIAGSQSDWLYVLQESDGDYSLLPDLGTEVVDDVMYISGSYELTQIDESLDVVFSLDLTTGELKLFGANMNGLEYGSAGLCWFYENTMTNLLGETAETFSYVGDKVVYSSMSGSYYTTSRVNTYADILGDKYALYWTDHQTDHPHKNNAQHYIGETGYSYEPLYLKFTKDCIFAMWVGKGNIIKTDMIIGIYDTDSDTARAAMISFPEEDFIHTEADHNFIDLIADGEAIYIPRPNSRQVTMFSAGDNS